MKDDAKLYTVINAMSRRQLGSCILQAGFAIPADKRSENLRDVVRSGYQDGSIEPMLILECYEEEAA